MRLHHVMATLFLAGFCQSVSAQQTAQPLHELPDYSDVAGKTSFVTLSAKHHADALQPIDPFLNSALPTPPKDLYDGRLFELRHDYPDKLPPATDYPWRKVTDNGRITVDNAKAYVEALKDYVADDMKEFLFNYGQWDPPKYDWWQSIWVGTEREPIRGIYVGSEYPAGTLPGQNLDLTTYVYVMYDGRAAKTLGDIWGTTHDRAMAPVLNKDTTQYADGSVIVKWAFVTSCGSDWTPMEGAASWKIYSTLNTSNGSGHSSTSMCPDNGSNGSINRPAVTNIYLMQFDIIVKDMTAAPETGWVFSTLVYDKSAPGEDAWDKMIVLGATWGGDPDVNDPIPSDYLSPVKPNPQLKQNYVNLSAPDYSLATLGWGGRLSGPNDGAVALPAWADSHYYPDGVASAGCLACHSTAQHPMTSFLLPTTTHPPSTTTPPGSSAPASDGALVLNPPGSDAWMKWFQSRAGDVPMDTGNIALDYDMVTAFKALPMWQAAVKARKAEEATAAAESK